jgi:phage terminase small subunit
MTVTTVPLPNDAAIDRGHGIKEYRKRFAQEHRGRYRDEDRTALRAPSWLDKQAQKIFRELVNDNPGLFAANQRMLLSCYCVACSRYIATLGCEDAATEKAHGKASTEILRYARILKLAPFATYKAEAPANPFDGLIWRAEK